MLDLIENLPSGWQGEPHRHPRRRKRSMVPDRLAPRAPDLVQRDFRAEELNEKWCGDITYVRVPHE
ncbi:hypothetical protein [Streptomyces sp. NPDC005423]|uniref:hypothetical protein n=1 Tax=Streptomyces sp. NPDC005423 TaxID=3155343 RepID=UPI0033A416D6